MTVQHSSRGLPDGRNMGQDIPGKTALTHTVITYNFTFDLSVKIQLPCCKRPIPSPTPGLRALKFLQTQSASRIPISFPVTSSNYQGSHVNNQPSTVNLHPPTAKVHVTSRSNISYGEAPPGKLRKPPLGYCVKPPPLSYPPSNIACHT